MPRHVSYTAAATKSQVLKEGKFERGKVTLLQVRGSPTDHPEGVIIQDARPGEAKIIETLSYRTVAPLIPYAKY